MPVDLAMAGHKQGQQLPSDRGTSGSDTGPTKVRGGEGGQGRL